ncbi:MAG: hypothetical protein GY835_18820 [bacterium]|nr:hypothetical protein [bacterium]
MAQILSLVAQTNRLVLDYAPDDFDGADFVWRLNHSPADCSTHYWSGVAEDQRLSPANH